MDQPRRNEIWILGATGRIGRSVAQQLSKGSTPVVLVGRSKDRLASVMESSGALRMIIASSAPEMVEAIHRDCPHVVVNLLGDYAETAPSIARACMPNGHYVDLANDLAAMSALLDLGDEAIKHKSTIITGAGFGVLATEAIVIALCADKLTPRRVRVDALPSFASEDGVTGQAFATSAVDVITAGGRRYVDGKLVPVRLASNVTRHTLPDGTTATSAVVPSGELLAARLASNAPFIDFTSSFAPTSLAIRMLLPLMSSMLAFAPIRRMMIRQMSERKTKAAPRPLPHSWGHVVVEWSDGSRSEGWLRADDAMEYSTNALAIVAAALARNEAPFGAFTPAAALGITIAESAGGQLLLDPPLS